VRASIIKNARSWGMGGGSGISDFAFIGGWPLAHQKPSKLAKSVNF
jgi:hypothetical protein